MHLMRVAYTSNEGGLYIQWGWRIHSLGMAYKNNEPLLLMDENIRFFLGNLQSSLASKPRVLKIESCFFYSNQQSPLYKRSTKILNFVLVFYNAQKFKMSYV